MQIKSGEQNELIEFYFTLYIVPENNRYLAITFPSILAQLFLTLSHAVLFHILNFFSFTEQYRFVILTCLYKCMSEYNNYKNH